MDRKTKEYYDQHAAEFARRTHDLDMSSLRQMFLTHVPPGGRILDAGCGSGRDARAFLDAGCLVCAIDASPGMCAEAEKAGIKACCMTFPEICGQALYDGIWASASLLHVPRREMPEVLRRFHDALRPYGVLYASLKRGSGEERRLGRFFSDYTLEEAEQFLTADGLFRVVEAFETADVRPDYAEKPWINLLLRAVP